MKRKLITFRCGVISLVIVYLFYLYIITLPPPAVEPVIVPTPTPLSDFNSFHTTPFYKRSSQARGSKDVTIVTQSSIDRLERVQHMVDAWQGPVSVAVYVRDQADLHHIDRLYNTSDSIRTLVDFHLLFAHQTRYPVNNLRNLALANARTSLVLILDADFVTSKNMHQYLSNFGHQLKTNTKLAYVIPAFSSSLPPKDLPPFKHDLLTAIHQDTVALSYKGPCPKCHGPTDYNNWRHSTEPYESRYQWIYEPYLFLNKDELTELFDERLKGYGFDKNTHSYALAVAGYRFVVLPEPFVIHLNHEEAKWDGPSIQEQLWEALTYVCRILPEVKIKYGYATDQRLFNEPINDDECWSRDHW